MEEDKNKKDKEKIDKLADKIKEGLENAGYQVVEPDDFFAGIETLYRTPTAEQVVHEELPIILEIEPDFFIKYGIDTHDMTRQLTILYQGGGPYTHQKLESVLWSFKVTFRHIRFFLRDAPEEKEERENTVNNLKLIMNGRWFLEQVLEYIMIDNSIKYDDYKNFRRELWGFYNPN